VKPGLAPSAPSSGTRRSPESFPRHLEALAGAQVTVEELDRDIAADEARLGSLAGDLRRVASGLEARALPVGLMPTTAIDVDAVASLRDAHDALPATVAAKRDLYAARLAHVEELRVAARDAVAVREQLRARIDLTGSKLNRSSWRVVGSGFVSSNWSMRRSSPAVKSWRDNALRAASSIRRIRVSPPEETTARSSLSSMLLSSISSVLWLVTMTWMPAEASRSESPGRAI